MGYKSSSLSCLAILLAFSSCIHALDVLKIFGSDPEFSQFTKALSDTKLADEINKRNTITVLALNNGAMGSLSGKPVSTLKDILSTHVLLDFYDEKSLFYAHTNHTKMVTLFQASGKAVNDQGFIYVSLINEGELAFASAVKNAAYNSLLVKTLGSTPYNISVVEVSAPIIAPGIDTAPATATATPVSNAPVPSSPKATPVSNAPVPSPPKEKTVSNAPVPSPPKEKTVSNAPVPSPPKAKTVAKPPVASAEAPAAEEEVSTTAAPAPTKEAESPVEAAAAPGPAAEEAVDDKVAPAPSSASSTQIGLVGAVMAMASLFVSL